MMWSGKRRQHQQGAARQIGPVDGRGLGLAEVGDHEGAKADGLGDPHDLFDALQAGPRIGDHHLVDHHVVDELGQVGEVTDDVHARTRRVGHRVVAGAHEAEQLDPPTRVGLDRLGGDLRGLAGAGDQHVTLVAAVVLGAPAEQQDRGANHHQAGQQQSADQQVGLLSHQRCAADVRQMRVDEQVEQRQPHDRLQPEQHEATQQPRALDRPDRGVHLTDAHQDDVGHRQRDHDLRCRHLGVAQRGQPEGGRDREQVPDDDCPEDLLRAVAEHQLRSEGCMDPVQPGEVRSENRGVRPNTCSCG